MSRLLITKRSEDWNVWISLDDHHPIDDPYGFVIGCGDTRDQAVANAIQDLEDAVQQLQQPQVIDEETLVV